METARHLVETIRQRYKSIKRDLDPNDKVIDELYQIKLISRECRESVLPLARSDRTRAIDKIIKDLVRKLEKLDDTHYEIRAADVLRIFTEHGYMYMLEAETMPQSTEDDLNPTLTEAQMKLLFNNSKNIELLKDDLEPMRLIDNLLVAGALTFDDHEDIRQTAHRHGRVKNLLIYVQTDIPQKGPVLLKAIQTNYPRLMKKLLNNLHTSGHEAHTDVQVRITSREGRRVANFEVLLDGDTDITVRLKFIGKQGEITVVEHDIADRPHPELDTEAMDCDTTITDIYFSSVVIRVRPLSASAATKLTDMLWNHPDGLKRWLTKLLNDEQLDKLKQAGWNSVSIEVNLVSPAHKSEMLCGCLITKQLLERDTVKALFYEHLQHVDRVIMSIYDMCRLTHFQRKEMTRFVNFSDPDKKMEAFINFLSSLSEEFLCVFEIALRETGQASLLERSCAEIDTDGCRKRNVTENSHRHLRRCTSLCSRDIIEELMEPVTEEGIQQLDMFLDELIQSETLSDIKLKKICEIQAISSDKTAQVLKLLTDLPQSCTCRLERFLKQTGQDRVLQYFKQSNDLLATGEITRDEAKENHTFLLHELEPKIFNHVLPDTEQTSVPSDGCRPDRCLVFLEKMLESDQCDVNVRKFVTALGQMKLYHILKILYSSKKSKNMERARVFGDILKQKILGKKSMIMDEVDITMLKATFVDRRVFTEEEFDAMINKESRRECVAALLKEVFQKGYQAMVCFVAALKLSGYIFVAGSIENTPDPILPCPCLDDATGSQTLLEASFSVELIVKDEERSDEMKSVQDVREQENADDKPNQHDVHKEKCHDHSVQKSVLPTQLHRSVGKGPSEASYDNDNLELSGISAQCKDTIKPSYQTRMESSPRSQRRTRSYLKSVKDQEKRRENEATNATVLLYDCRWSQRHSNQFCCRYDSTYPSALLYRIFYVIGCRDNSNEKAHSFTLYHTIPHFSDTGKEAF